MEYVITLEQDRAAEARAAAQEVRVDAQRIREEARRIRQEVQQQIQHGMQDPDPDLHPGAVVVQVPTPAPWAHNDIPPQVADLATMFIIAMVICIVGWPIARALGRWIDRRGLPSPVNADFTAQMTRIEQAVDSMSVEVERISEAQRYQAKLLSDREKVRA